MSLTEKTVLTSRDHTSLGYLGDRWVYMARKEDIACAARSVAENGTHVKERTFHLTELTRIESVSLID